MNLRLRDVVVAADFASGVVAFALTAYFAPERIGMALAKDLFGTGLSVLSIVFSIYFAALATFASASDDDFIAFLEQDNSFSEIMGALRFTLALLFAALLLAIVAYATTAIAMSILPDGSTQSRWWLAGFAFFFCWSLFATNNSAGDAIRYAIARMRYVKLKRPQREGRRFFDGP